MAARIHEEARKQLIHEVLLAAHGGWKPCSEEQEKRIELAAQRFELRRTLHYRLKFWFWRLRLDVYAFRRGCRYRYAKMTGLDCWFEHYERGYSPSDALEEDWSYA